ncbi:MAG: S41 family peptidase [Bacteroidales bacterium]|nr:S41 family peptidase [Bacteroidales bacterium]
MEKERRKPLFKQYLPVILALTLIAGFIMGLNLRMGGPADSEGRFFSIGTERHNKVNDVLNYVLDAYVDSVSRQQLTEETIRSLLKNLDPHSSYIPASEFRRLNDPLMGSFEGIGIEFNMIKDTVVVIQPIPGGPSERAGLLPGDRIVMVEDTLIAGVSMSTADIVDLLMGKKGTEVNIAVFRLGIPELLRFSLIRDKIPSYSLDIAYMVNHETGYIKLNKFSATTHQEFVNGVEQLLAEGMQQMILDLRGNTGGFLDAAILLADELLEPGRLIVYTDGRKRSRTQARARRPGIFEHQPLVILIDEWSASASEIIAGAVQDNDRGLIVGRRSFGKGLVQEQVQLGDGSALRLTVARYYTPTGRSIQNPYDEGDEAYFNEFLQRFHNGEMHSPDSIFFDDTQRFETPAGRTVFGGGGIMPDVFVPLSSENLSFFNLVSNRGHIYMFAFNYADRHRAQLEKQSNAAGFVSEFSFSHADYLEFLDFVRAQGTRIPDDISPESEAMIKNHLKAYTGRNIFGAQAFYPVLHEKDRGFKKALQTLGNEELLLTLTTKKE